MSENVTMKDKLKELANELSSKTGKTEIELAIDALSEKLVTNLNVTYEEIDTTFIFKVKALDMGTQIKMEQINFPTNAERKRFIVQQCVIEPKLNMQTINKMPEGMIDSIVATANVLAFSCKTQMDLSKDSPNPSWEDTSGESVRQSESPPEKS